MLGATVLTGVPSAVAAVIGAPDRVPVEVWANNRGLGARAANELFAATGEIVCQWEHPTRGTVTSYSSGQVTGAGNIVTMAGHSFLDPYECFAKAGPGDCRFSVIINGVTETATAIDLIAIGIDCGPPRASTRERLSGDWAVVRLDRYLDVMPYRLPDDIDLAIVPGAAVFSVIYSQDYLVREGNRDTHPKTVGQCYVRDIQRRFNQLTYFASDCDGAQRSSGGSILAADLVHPTLIGIWAASTEGRFALDLASARMRSAGFYRDDFANNGAYDTNTWSSRHIPVSGVMVQAIRNAMAQQ